MIPLKWFALILAIATLLLLALIRAANRGIRDLHERRVNFRLNVPPEREDEDDSKDDNGTR